MDLRPLLFGLLFAAMAHGEEIPRAAQVVEPPEPLRLKGQDRVISSTGQFTVTGGETGDRAEVVLLAEEAKNELLRLTEEKDTWDLKKIPITLTLYGKPGDPMPARTIATRILFSEAGYGVHLDVHLSRGIERERFKSAITAALVYERTLRERVANDTETAAHVPPWLVDGLREANSWRLDQTDRRLYVALFKSGGLFKIEDLFALDDQGFEQMDGAMRAAFRISSGALVMALLEQPQGKNGFRAFLSEVADFQGETPALLRKHFPELNLSETSLAKWWALQLAVGGRNLATDVLSIQQTDVALKEALRLNFRTAEGILEQKEIAAWPEVAALPEPERISSVRLAQDGLVRLSYRCFPSYRPLLAEYQLLLTALAKNQTKDLVERLAKLDERRATMMAKAAHAHDYLIWFEITRANETSSGDFEDYVRLKDRLKANPHQRTDELSKYLDRLDAIFNRGAAPDAGPGDESIPDLPDLTPLPEQ